MNLEDFYNQLTKVLFKFVNNGELPKNITVKILNSAEGTNVYFYGDSSQGWMIRWTDELKGESSDD